MQEEKKFNCFACKYQGKVPGSAHIKCNHPSIKKAHDDPFLNLMSTFASVGRAPTMNVSTKELNIQVDPYGIKKGWFNFPWNFDPAWLRNCDGFEPEEPKQ